MRTRASSSSVPIDKDDDDDDDEEEEEEVEDEGDDDNKAASSAATAAEGAGEVDGGALSACFSNLAVSSSVSFSGTSIYSVWVIIITSCTGRTCMFAYARSKKAVMISDSLANTLRESFTFLVLRRLFTTKANALRPSLVANREAVSCSSSSDMLPVLMRPSMSRARSASAHKRMELFASASGGWYVDVDVVDEAVEWMEEEEGPVYELPNGRGEG